MYHVRLPLVIPRELWGAGAAVARAARAVKAVAIRNIVKRVGGFRRVEVGLCLSVVLQARVLMAQFRGLKSDLIKKKVV